VQQQQTTSPIDRITNRPHQRELPRPDSSEIDRCGVFQGQVGPCRM
jgi:hypothetical protein